MSFIVMHLQWTSVVQDNHSNTRLWYKCYICLHDTDVMKSLANLVKFSRTRSWPREDDKEANQFSCCSNFEIWIKYRIINCDSYTQINLNKMQYPMYVHYCKQNVFVFLSILIMQIKWCANKNNILTSFNFYNLALFGDILWFYILDLHI